MRVWCIMSSLRRGCPDVSHAATAFFLFLHGYSDSFSKLLTFWLWLFMLYTQVMIVFVLLLNSKTVSKKLRKCRWRIDEAEQATGCISLELHIRLWCRFPSEAPLCYPKAQTVFCCWNKKWFQMWVSVKVDIRGTTSVCCSLGVHTSEGQIHIRSSYLQPPHSFIHVGQLALIHRLNPKYSQRVY